MQPNKCLACGGSDFHHGPVKIGLLKWPLAIGGHFGGCYIQAAAWMACGTVATYVDEPTLEWLRRKAGWTPKEVTV